jgi:hypothetical protein
MLSKTCTLSVLAVTPLVAVTFAKPEAVSASVGWNVAELVPARTVTVDGKKDHFVGLVELSITTASADAVGPLTLQSSVWPGLPSLHVTESCGQPDCARALANKPRTKRDETNTGLS